MPLVALTNRELTYCLRDSISFTESMCLWADSESFLRTRYSRPFMTFSRSCGMALAKVSIIGSSPSTSPRQILR